ncbi:bifunctional 2',3'-cyclic-nucleotide 2'-phosphodiesterase/3'-nucleotidase [Aestuariibius sp. HNIBRBA575]|uniref:bifunctional 2',3'-cyclic-nucleotide 2'-phosphodiesterase/3'-nucleotidase n=1 Tax=Aestuariibius sp. HNIBRBA575 TaxID=3233343 RepID=UPI0034A0E96B
MNCQLLQLGPHKTSVERQQSQLRIFATTDLHVHLIPYDYFRDRPSQRVGLTQTAGLLREMRAEVANSVLLDNGDFLQGNPLSDVIAAHKLFGKGKPHPAISAMNTLRYDAGTLGNHEFNYGLDFLDLALSEADFPLVSCNVTRRGHNNEAEDEPLVPPFALIEREMVMNDGSLQKLRIGVIGFAPPQLTQWDRHLLHGRVETTDIVISALKYVPKLKEAGADIVIALCHSGIGPESHTIGMENAAVPLAAIEGIDVVLAGHTHMVFPGPEIAASSVIDPQAGTLHGKPTVMAGFYGSHLGVIDLTMLHDNDTWQIMGHTSRAEPVLVKAEGKATALRTAPDDQLLSKINHAHQATLSHIRRPIGVTTGDLHSYFSMVAPDACLQILADAQREFAIKQLRGTEFDDRPILSAMAPFKAGGRAGPENYIDIPAGPLTLRSAAELYPFPNTLCILDISGLQVIDWLERSAAAFCKIEPGEVTQNLLDFRAPSYCFDVLQGLTYQIDPTQPPRYNVDGELMNPQAQRVSDIRYHGTLIEPDQHFLVVSNSYRAGGGGKFQSAISAKLIGNIPTNSRDILIDYIRDRPSITPHAPQIWRFATLPNTKAIFRTGPGACAHTYPAHSRHLGTGLNGFEMFELDFDPS